MKFTVRHIIILLLLVLTADLVSGQEERSVKFKKGVEYYTASKYQEALNEWLDIYNTGYRSAELDYNIGNAYFKLNNVPGSILFFERAHLLKPADNNINYNLQIARTLVIDKFEDIPELFFVKWFDFKKIIILALCENGNFLRKLSLLSNLN